MAEPTVNQLVATTLNNYHKEFADNVSNSNAITALLQAGQPHPRHRRRQGDRPPADLRRGNLRLVSRHRTAVPRRQGDDLARPTTRRPTRSPRVTLSGPDLAKNRGRERILNLLEGKMDNAEATMKNNITKAVYGDGTVAKSFAGLKAMVTDDGIGTVGGIDAGTWPFWKNQFQAVARATGLQYPALKAAMNALWMKLIRGTEHPDLIVADAEVYGTYESGLQENQRYADAKLGALGFETLKYKQAAIVFDGAATGLDRRLLPEHQVSEVRDLLGPQFRDARPARPVARHGRHHQAHRLHGRADPVATARCRAASSRPAPERATGASMGAPLPGRRRRLFSFPRPPPSLNEESEHHERQHCADPLRRRLGRRTASARTACRATARPSGSSRRCRRYTQVDARGHRGGLRRVPRALQAVPEGAGRPAADGRPTSGYPLALWPVITPGRCSRCCRPATSHRRAAGQAAATQRRRHPRRDHANWPSAPSR